MQTTFDEDVVTVAENLVGEAVQRIGSFHSVADSEIRFGATSDVMDEAAVDGNDLTFFSICDHVTTNLAVSCSNGSAAYGLR